MTFKKTKLVLGIATATLTMSAAFLSPEALAHHSAKKHTHKASRTARTSSSSFSGGYSKVDALESQVRAMQNEIAALRSQSATAPAAAVDTAKIEELDQWMASVKAAPVIEKTRDNLVFFRGGYDHANSQRGGTLDPTVMGLAGNSNGLINGPVASKDAWYFGAGFDFGLSNDLLGFMDNTQLAAELMFDYKQFGGAGGANGLASPTTLGVVNAAGKATGSTVTIPALNTQSATVSMFTLAASPKIKFMKNTAFNPWIIPVGFELNVISPPSNAITVLNPGMQFGIGADYKVWKSLYIGADARYHQSLGRLDGINTSGVSAGGYVGFGF